MRPDSFVIVREIDQIALSSGNVNEDINFEYGERATAANGCGVVFKGNFLYFGGNGAANVRQVISTSSFVQHNEFII